MFALHFSLLIALYVLLGLYTDVIAATMSVAPGCAKLCSVVLCWFFTCCAVLSANCLYDCQDCFNKEHFTGAHESTGEVLAGLWDKQVQAVCPSRRGYRSAYALCGSGEPPGVMSKALRTSLQNSMGDHSVMTT